MILEAKDIQRPLMEYYKNGGGKTYYLGFTTLSNHYSIKEGGVTDWSGYAASGKTELLLECLKNCSEWYGHKHLIYMPDAGSTVEVVGKLLHKMSGKQIEKFYYKDGQKVEIQNRISEEEILKLLPTVLEYFKVFVPKENNRSKLITPSEFWKYAEDNKKSLGLFSAVIDSWNYMKHDLEGKREDKWLEETLSFRNETAENSGLHLHTIIHPRSAKTNKDGKIIIPDMHNLKGGSEWSNNGKTIIIVHRDFDSNETTVKIDKAKPKIVGVQGVVNLRYDVNTSRYYEFIGGEGGQGVKKFAEKNYVEDKPIQNAMQVNENFDNKINDLPF